MNIEPAVPDGTAIRRIRKRNGLKLRELADSAGITTGYLCHIEKGKRRGAPGTVLAIAKALAVDVNDITTDIVVDAA